jgi:hypothetical protein
MKASEHLLLGSTMVKQWRAGDQSGCALGMIQAAGGYEQLARWINNTPVAVQACDCTEDIVMGPACQDLDRRDLRHVGRTIMHVFNYHIMTKKDWTIERLADWLDAVDPTLPAEPEPLPAPDPAVPTEPMECDPVGECD